MVSVKNLNSLRCCFDLRFFVSLILISLFPSFLYVYFQTSSLAAGLVISSFFVFFIYFFDENNVRVNKKILFIGFCFFVFLFISSVYFFVELDNRKPLFSMFLMFELVPAFFMGRSLSALNYEKIQGTIFYFITLLVFLGSIKFFWIPEWGNYILCDKPVFPFSEESHFALILGFFSIVYVLNAKKWGAIFVFFSLICFSFIFPSLTMFVFLVVCVFSFSLRFRTRYLVVFISFFVFCLCSFFVFFLDYFPYFKSRLTLDGLDNLTTLVFLQGWSLAYLNFFETNGFGLGFQMLSSNGTVYPYFTNIIYDLTGGSLNVADGGFLAAKIIAEFGMLGVMVVIFYLCYLSRFILRANIDLNKMLFLKSKNLACHLKKRLLFSAFFFGFFIEFFFRGYGYFSPSLFMLVVAYVALLKSSKMEKKHI